MYVLVLVSLSLRSAVLADRAKVDVNLRRRGKKRGGGQCNEKEKCDGTRHIYKGHFHAVPISQ
jgi:hypothetical protein